MFDTERSQSLNLPTRCIQSLQSLENIERDQILHANIDSGSYNASILFPTSLSPLYIGRSSSLWNPKEVFQVCSSLLNSILEEQEGGESEDMSVILELMIDAVLSHQPSDIDDDDTFLGIEWRESVEAIRDPLLLLLSSDETHSALASRLLTLLLTRSVFGHSLLFSEGSGSLLSTLRVAYPPNLSEHSPKIQMEIESLLSSLVDSNEEMKDGVVTVLNQFSQSFGSVFERSGLSKLL